MRAPPTTRSPSRSPASSGRGGSTPPPSCEGRTGLRALLRRTPPGGGQAEEFGYAELRGGNTRLTIIPALGGKIASMSIGGREWLWRNDKLPYRTPLDGASYGETAATGGYDECFPTIAACHVPASVPVYGGLALPDHGELWSGRPAIEVATPDAGGATARTVWTGRRMPYRFSRTVRVTADGAVEMHYEVRNDASVRLPFMWAAYPTLPLTPQTRIIVPAGSRVRVGAQHGIDIGGPGATHEWPRVKSGEKMLDLSAPDSAAKKYAVKLHLEPGPGRVAIEEGTARLEVTYDSKQIPDLGLWINRRGLGGASRRQAPLTVGIQPAIGAPDSLAEGLGSWQRAHWLEAGETREWSLAWRGTP